MNTVLFHKHINGYFALAALVLLSACGGPKHDQQGRGMRIVIDDTAARAAEAASSNTNNASVEHAPLKNSLAVNKRLEPSFGVLAPSPPVATADISCFIVNAVVVYPFDTVPLILLPVQLPMAVQQARGAPTQAHQAVLEL